MGSAIEEAKNSIGASREAEERREKSEDAVHRLEQVIEQQRHSDVERERDEVDGDIYSRPVNEELGGWGRQKIKQVEDAGKSGPGTR